MLGHYSLGMGRKRFCHQQDWLKFHHSLIQFFDIPVPSAMPDVFPEVSPWVLRNLFSSSHRPLASDVISE